MKNFGSCPYLVKRGGLEVLHRFSVQRTGEKTASFLREEPSNSLSEVPALSTSPNMAKSPSNSESYSMGCNFSHSVGSSSFLILRAKSQLGMIHIRHVLGNLVC